MGEHGGGERELGFRSQARRGRWREGSQERQRQVEQVGGEPDPENVRESTERATPGGQVRHAGKVDRGRAGETGREKKETEEDRGAGHQDVQGRLRATPRTHRCSEPPSMGWQGPEATVCPGGLDTHATPGSPKCLCSRPCPKGAQVRMGLTLNRENFLCEISGLASDRHKNTAGGLAQGHTAE